MEAVTEFSYQGDRINSLGGCVEAVLFGIRIEMVIFRECQDLVCVKNYPLEIKRNACKSCVRLAILYVSYTWSLVLKETGILHKTERAMERSEIKWHKSTKDQMQLVD